ncbi:MAG TPA: hypothetical protein VN476_00660 [Pyrinomonadaceae bacterium]|nr:hypothetical protein [Pyrinomonadaceae bacterium]
MNLGSKRNMMLMGFTLSLVSVVFNSLVITYVNRRLKEVDDERASLSDSLERQAAALSDGDSQFAFYRITHNLMYAVQPRDQEVVQTDAAGQLTKALQRYYQAAYDVPQTEIISAELEDFGQRLPTIEKQTQLARDAQAATSPAERERLRKQQEDLEKQLPEPKSDLARKLRELSKFSYDAENTGNEVMLDSALLPMMKSFQNEFITSTEKKRSRIRELQAARASLVRKSEYASAAAIFFQLLGLMFILARDLWNQRVAALQKAG